MRLDEFFIDLWVILTFSEWNTGVVHTCICTTIRVHADRDSFRFGASAVPIKPCGDIYSLRHRKSSSVESSFRSYIRKIVRKNCSMWELGILETLHDESLNVVVLGRNTGGNVNVAAKWTGIPRARRERRWRNVRIFPGSHDRRTVDHSVLIGESLMLYTPSPCNHEKYTIQSCHVDIYVRIRKYRAAGRGGTFAYIPMARFTIFQANCEKTIPFCVYTVS